ncbi:MAG: PilZ domain-containing protein [Leptospirales bacterium]|nr:PilZ domain-containing protein [Leptospirales bacterium]
MRSERAYPRVSPRDFEDYSVQLLAGDSFFSGMLGNISEDGLCVLIPGNVEIPDDCRQIERGNILSRHLKEPIEFRGDIVWTAPAEGEHEQLTMAGIHFQSALALPESLTARSLSMQD